MSGPLGRHRVGLLNVERICRMCALSFTGESWTKLCPPCYRASKRGRRRVKRPQYGLDGTYLGDVIVEVDVEYGGQS